MEQDRILLQLVEEVLTKMGTPPSNIEMSQEERACKINIESDDTNLLIGYHGEAIKALEHIIKLMFWKKVVEPEISPVIDIQNYRKRQEQSVLEMAEKKAVIAKKTGKTQIMPPMSPYFRRLVHLHLTQPTFNDIETHSIGEGDRRQITIKIKELNV